MRNYDSSTPDIIDIPTAVANRNRRRNRIVKYVSIIIGVAFLLIILQAMLESMHMRGDIIFIFLVWSLIWGFVTRTVSRNRGYEGGFWWGFFLAFIGLIVVACKPVKYDRLESWNDTSMNYSANTTRIRENSVFQTTNETDDVEIENIKKLKMYKELLDSEAITQEEFDRKKEELLFGEKRNN